jgi:hypothetical protein
MVTMHADLDNHLTHASIDISAAAASIVLCVQGHDVVALSGAGRFVVSEAAIHKARQVRRCASFSALLGRVNGNSIQCTPPGRVVLLHSSNCTRYA